MRLLRTGLFVFGSILLAIILLADKQERSQLLLSFVIFIVTFALLLLLCIVAGFLFSSDPAKEREKQMRAWEAQGLVTVTNYHFTRMLLIEDDGYGYGNDEALRFFFQVDNGAILYLCGPYLLGAFAGYKTIGSQIVFMSAEVVPTMDDATATEIAEAIEPNELTGRYKEVTPAYELTVKRHRSDNRIVQVVCKDIPPVVDIVEHGFWENACCQNRVFNDGDIITDCTYNQLITGV